MLRRVPNMDMQKTGENAFYRALWRELREDKLAVVRSLIYPVKNRERADAT